MLTTNVRWLSRHRHARCLVPEIAEALLVVFAETDPPSRVRRLFCGARKSIWGGVAGVAGIVAVGSEFGDEGQGLQ